jgi:hypothetical protein
MNTSLEQHRIALREHQEENAFLKEILASRGISYQKELEKRSAAKARNPSFGNSTTIAQSGIYNPMTLAPSSASGYSPQPTIPDRSYGAGRMGNMAGSSATGGTHHSYSPTDPGIFEQAIKHESPGVPEMPGIFETDPQLQVEFILAYVPRLVTEDIADSVQGLRRLAALMANILCGDPSTHPMILRKHCTRATL